MAIEYWVRPCYNDFTEQGTYGSNNYEPLQVEGLDDEEMEYIFKHLAAMEKSHKYLEIFVNAIFQRVLNEKGLLEELKRTGSEYLGFYFKNPFGNRKLYIACNIRLDDEMRLWIDDCRVKTLKGAMVARFKQNVAGDAEYVSYLA